MHQIYKGVPKKKKKKKAHNIITDLKIDLNFFFLIISGIHKMYTQTLRTKSNTFDAH